MNKLSRLRRSRDSWKSKATERAEQVREFRKTKARYQERLEGLQSRLETLEHQLSQKKKARRGATLK
jgi:predicted  nucleic acid-binding Zn-ribbon protein